jgi:hypothetical protein
MRGCVKITKGVITEAEESLDSIARIARKWWHRSAKLATDMYVQ